MDQLALELGDEPVQLELELVDPGYYEWLEGIDPLFDLDDNYNLVIRKPR